MSRSFALLVALVFLIGGCTGQQPQPTETAATDARATESPEDDTAGLEPLSFLLDFRFEAQHMPFLHALEQGYYAEEGIDLRISEGTGSATTLPAVGQSHFDIGFADPTVAVIQINEGLPVKIVDVVFRQNAISLSCWRDAGVETLKDIEGKTFLVSPGEQQTTLFPVLAELNDIDESSVTFQNVDQAAKTTLFLDGRADCIWSLSYASAGRVEVAEPDVAPPLLWSAFGFDLPGHAIIADVDALEEKRDLIAGFIRATRRGFEEVCANPEIGVDLYLEKIDPEGAEYAELATPRYCDTIEPAAGSPFGPAFTEMTEDEWQVVLDFLIDLGRIEEAAPVDQYYDYVLEE